jgi:small subunit ribosomal protein S1
MVEVGSVINAKVVRIEPYGVWLDFRGERALVLVPELSWKKIAHPTEIVHEGDAIDVYVSHYNYKDQVIVGSVKRLCPEQNPYRELSRFAPGTPLHATVVSLFSDEVTVELANGAWGHIRRDRLPEHIQRGDSIEAVITDLQVDQGRLTLEPTGQTIKPVDAPVAQPANPVLG